MKTRGTLVAFGCLLAACQSAPDEAPSVAAEKSEAVAGRGVFEVSEAPQGAKLWQRPQWRVGDRFTLLRGERMKGTFEVTGIADGAYVIDMGSGSEIRRNQDLGNLGHWLKGKDGPERAMLPADARYHWPLWVGKRWTCEFVDRARSGRELRMIASYEVEDTDRITVAAGTFETLRIRRSLRLADDDVQLTTCQMIWYAPDAGLEVRQLLGDSMVDLVDYERGPTR